MKSHRSYTHDPMRWLMWPLMLALVTDFAMWKFYVGNGWIAALWLIPLVSLLVYAKKTS